MKQERYNHLGQEKSPYLLQHKDNPVHWYAWGEEAFEVAKRENKPVFLSIGYSTCYWCHVMEKDSFEREDVAEVLNNYFISIKVDREERPDVDQIYMDAVVGLTGHGGWPMSVFLTPELKPFFGGTFFYREQFIQLLKRIHEIWLKEREDLYRSAEGITEFLRRRDGQQGPQPLTKEIFLQTLSDSQQIFDAEFGGFGSAPKFPPSERISLLLRIARRHESAPALSMVTKTLEAMARGGMYDHLGGGFHRYSTDKKWLVPHFEKMLYDNALLSWVYLEAYQVTKNPMFSAVAREILDYVLREMTDAQGGFFSAQDAGEVGKEGEYYVWTRAELRSVLTSDEFELFQEIYGISEQGNFEHHTNILSFQPSFSWDIKSDPKIQSAHRKLLSLREKREQPHRDDKILTDWNGLMLSSFARGYQVLGEARYLEAAQKSAQFIQEKLYIEGKLFHRYRDSSSDFPAYLDDYAFLIQGLLNLYETDFNEKWIRFAIELQEIQDKVLEDEQEGGYFFSRADDPTILVRRKEFADGAEPSGNAVSAHNLFRFHDFLIDRKYQMHAQKTLEAMSSPIKEHPSAYASALIAVDYMLDRAKEVVLVTNSSSSLSLPKNEPFLQYLWKTFLPNQVLAFGKPTPLESSEGLPLFRGREVLHEKTTAYVCEENTCKMPTTELEQLKVLVNEFRRY